MSKVIFIIEERRGVGRVLSENI